MTLNRDDVIRAWDQVAADPVLRRAAIHPTGTDEAAYLESGRVTADRILEVLPPSRYPTVGDFGCGDGRVLRHLPIDSHGYNYREVWGVDASPAMIDAVEAPGPLYLIATTDPADLPTVDAWYCLAVLIHQSIEDGLSMILDLVEHTRLGGRLVLDLPTYERARERESWTDVTVWSPSHLEALIEALPEGAVVSNRVNAGSFSFANIGEHHGDWTVIDLPPVTGPLPPLPESDYAEGAVDLEPVEDDGR